MQEELVSTLEEELSKSDNVDVSEVIDEFFENNEVDGTELYDTIEQDKIDTENKEALGWTEDQIAESKIIETVEVDGYTIEYYSNGTFAVEYPEEETLAPAKSGGFSTMAKATTKSKKATSKREYRSWVGVLMFTVGQEGYFNYNGSKATYKSGFDGWYKRGTFSIWQVDKWDPVKEASGKNYTFTVKGNFHWGAEIKGVGLTIQDLRVKQVITCKPDGTTSVKYTLN